MNHSDTHTPGQDESLPAKSGAPSLSRKLLRLALALFAFWLIVYVLAPLPVEHFTPMREYAKVVDRTGIVPGALYYSDVDQSFDAEINNRDAIRFFVAAPGQNENKTSLP